MAPHQTLLQKGLGNDLFVFAHIDPTAIRAEVLAATDDDVVTELWGVGTSAYRPVLAAYGGWTSYVERLAVLHGTAGFDHTTITCWSAGGAFAQEVLLAGAEPDAIVLLDAIYGTKPAGSKTGDGNVIWTERLAAVARYALAAAHGERILVLMHSAIATPYASSGECVRAIVAWVEDQLGHELPHDDSLPAADLEGRGFTEALALGGLHVVAFPGNDAAEHIAEAHLFDRAWLRWIPWSRAEAEGTAAPAPTRPQTPAMPTLRLGSSGAFVRAWQEKLVGLGWAIVVDGLFGPATWSSTRALQRQAGIEMDGVVGAVTRAAAERLVPRAAPVDDPGPPPFPMLSDGERDRLFGVISFRPSPTASNPEGITILGTWTADNIVSVHLPQLQGIGGAPASCKVPFHRLAAAQLRDLWSAWERDGLLHLVRSWSGSWAPRFVRGRPGVLSRHAHALAFDVNAPWNPLGRAAVSGAAGSVLGLVRLAREHGFFWGGNFESRPDPMHFEIGHLEGT